MTILKLEEIQDIVKEYAYVSYLPFYPKEDKYIEISLIDSPFKIERGHDLFSYNGYKNKSQRHLWYVSRSDVKHSGLYIHSGFLTFEKAIKETLEKYNKEICEQLEKSKKTLNLL